MGTYQDWEPEETAEQLGITIVDQALKTANALWIPEDRRILIRPCLCHLDRRCVLAHEVTHALAGHAYVAPLMTRIEAWTRRETAKTLVDPDMLRDLMAWRPDPAEWCRELRVNPATLREAIGAYRVA